MQKLIVARSWRTFEQQQVVAIKNLRKAFPATEYDLEVHLCINETAEDFGRYVEIAKSSMANPPTLFFYQESFLDRYAEECGASVKQVEKFKEWKWIYHILLYHFLYHEKEIDYFLTYDDDIFFKEEIGEVKYLLNNKIPFAIGDKHSDSDKCLIGKLAIFFGEWIIDEYFGSYGSVYASNSGLMGIANREIFKEFSRGKCFSDLLDFFVYKNYIHEDREKTWDEYKILLQEQSFLGILNRALTDRKHIILTEKDGYSIENLNQSKVQHYVGYLKMKEEFKKRIENQYKQILLKND